MRIGRVLSLVLALLTVGAVTAIAPAAPAASGPVIAILDSGIRPGHPEFSTGQIVGWRDFINGQATPYDDQGHGTAVASLAAGKNLGSAPGAALLIGKVLTADDTATWGVVANGINWAVTEGADVINVSLWQQTPNPYSSVLLSLAIQNAYDHGVVVVWIAGNGYGNGVVEPNPIPSTVLPGANSAQVIVAGSADRFGNRSSFSQLDPEVLAVGQPAQVACGSASYCTGRQGTSYAAPRLAGYVARLLAEGAPADPDWIEWVLLHSATDRERYTYVEEGYGFFDDVELDRALAVARGQAAVPGVDERDAFHLAVTGARAAQSAAVPVGALPPS